MIRFTGINGLNGGRTDGTGTGVDGIDSRVTRFLRLRGKIRM